MEQLNSLTGSASNVALPDTSNFTEADNTYIERTKKGISGKVVKEVVLPEESKYDTPSYLVDLRNTGIVSSIAFDSFKSLVSKKKLSSEHIAVYLYTKDKVVKIGYGDTNTLYMSLKKISMLLFKAPVYINKDGKFSLLGDNDVFGLRLNL